MEYFGKNIGKLGFGLMRLPKIGEEIDIEQTKVMVDQFLEAGFNYFDTAWAYGGSEDAIRQALVERYPRDRFFLASKAAAWLKCKTKEEAYAQFDESLRRSGAGYFDFYLLHNIGEARTKVFDDFDMYSWIMRKKEEGLVKHIGFSFHSTAEELDAVLAAHPEMEFVQLQINYADWESPDIQSRKCYETARKYNVPIVIMEPVKGGMLATPPEEVISLFRKEEPDSSTASWGIRFAADLPGVMTVLSGMSSVEQMEDNISFMKDFTGLTDRQRETIVKARELIGKVPIIPCTSCDYCAKVCPMEIGISGTFTAMNVLTLYGNMPLALGREGWLVGGHGRKHATECIHCGACEQACPQHIKIREALERACSVLGIR